MNFLDHKDLGNHLLQLCPKVVKHPVYICIYVCVCGGEGIFMFRIERVADYRSLYKLVGIHQ